MLTGYPSCLGGIPLTIPTRVITIMTVIIVMSDIIPEVFFFTTDMFDFIRIGFLRYSLSPADVSGPLPQDNHNDV